MTNFVLLLLFAQAVQGLPASQSRTPATSASRQNETGELQRKLLGVKRIYVDSFGDDAISKQTQAMVVSALTSSGRFVVTENKDKADAILRGAALEKTSQEYHALNDSAAVGRAAGGHSGSLSGTFHNGSGTISGSSAGGFAASSIAVDDSTASTETIDHARVAVRLATPDGDVIWATTQESKGAKYKGASADVAERIVRQLVRDIEKAQKPAPSAPM